MTAPLLTDDPAPFREWLLAQPEGAVVGVARSPCRCPVATFVKTREAAAMVTRIEVWASSGHRRTPRWAAKFIGAIDNKRGRDVTREEALKVLSEVTR